MSGKYNYVRTGRFSEPDPDYVKRKAEEKIREEEIRQERVRSIREEERRRDLEASLRRQKELAEEYEKKYGKKPSPGARGHTKPPSPPRATGPKYPPRPSSWFNFGFGNNKRSRSRSPRRSRSPKQKIQKTQQIQKSTTDKNCPSENVSPVPIDDINTYKYQSRIFHPNNNTNCTQDAHNKFIELGRLNDSYKATHKTGGKSKKHAKKHKRRTMKTHKK